MSSGNQTFLFKVESGPSFAALFADRLSLSKIAFIKETISIR